MSRDQVRQLCRPGRWSRLARSHYLTTMPATAGGDTRRARIRAAVASLGPDAVAVLDTAAEMHGIAGLRRSEAVHVSVPPGRPRAQRRIDPLWSCTS